MKAERPRCAVCRSPRPTFRDLRSAILPTLPVFTASPADRASQQNLVYQEIARSTNDTVDDKERPEVGPDVKRGRIRPLALLSSLPSGSRVWRRCAPRIFSASRAQFCTSEQRFPLTITNYYHLEEIGFDSQNCAQPAPTCARCLWPETKTTPRPTRILTPNRSSFFSLHPGVARLLDRSSRAAPPICMESRGFVHPQCPR